MTKFRYSRARYIAFTAVFAALSTALMYASFSVPFMPSFIKLDFSEVPALIVTYALGPVSGVLVCLIKNLINMAFTTTGCVGELSNFLLGVMLVLPAGLIYNYKRNRIGALIGAIVGSLIMGLGSLVTNYFIVYPVYMKLFMPEDVIISMYQAIFSGVDSLWDCLLIFNFPYTIGKGLLCAVITFLIYKPISQVMKIIESKMVTRKKAKQTVSQSGESAMPSPSAVCDNDTCEKTEQSDQKTDNN